VNTTVVVDYGVGNLLSVTRALAECGAEVSLTGDPQAVAAARCLVLPGVGAFGDCMVELERRGLAGPLRDYLRSGRPALGICVGMQVLLDIGEEFGEHAGLGIIPGRVRAIPNTRADGTPHKIPHIGWSEIYPSPGRSWADTIFAAVRPGSCCYFVHSFTAEPADPAHRLADCDYNGRLVCAAVQAGAVYGVQFHPEKSGAVGLAILRRFLELATAVSR